MAPRLGIGCRMSTAVWPGIWRAMSSGGFAANAIQNSLRELNLLEDLRGLEAGDADTAAGYYRDGLAVDGETFAGHPSHAELGYMSEWGLATHAGDLRNVLARVPEKQRKARVFLAGHSMGAMFVEAWAAWRFEDGVRGAEELAGIVLLDGILREAPIDEPAYMDGQADPLTPLPGLKALREGSKAYYALPILGIDVFTTLAIQGLRARQAPTELLDDPVAEELIGLLLGLNADALPKLTNRGALGLALDSASLPIGQFAISVGQATGGPSWNRKPNSSPVSPGSARCESWKTARSHPRRRSTRS